MAGVSMGEPQAEKARVAERMARTAGRLGMAKSIRRARPKLATGRAPCKPDSPRWRLCVGAAALAGSLQASWDRAHNR